MALPAWVELEVSQAVDARNRCFLLAQGPLAPGSHARRSPAAFQAWHGRAHSRQRETATPARLIDIATITTYPATNQR